MLKNLFAPPILKRFRITEKQAEQMVVMSGVLDRLPEATARVQEDLLRAGKGKADPMMTAKQVLRAGVLQQLTGADFDELAFDVGDSNCCANFCQIGPGQRRPTKKVLQENITSVEAETWEAIEQMAKDKANSMGVDWNKKTGKQILRNDHRNSTRKSTRKTVSARRTATGNKRRSDAQESAGSVVSDESDN